ncbi:MAG: hypothetical protein ACJ72Z_02670 [Pyrinomonadaceae bacterium]
MRRFFSAQIAVLIFVLVCSAQEQTDDSIVAVLDSKWERVRVAGQKIDNNAVAPVRGLTANDKYYQRASRENQPKGVPDPSEETTDGRAAALERSVQQARTTKTDDVNGYRYSVSFRNNSDRKIEVLFWEYRFKEYANPSNVVRRQFLCSLKAKPGEKFDLSATSTLGPSEMISADSLKDSSGKIFEEKVFLNRIEFADGAILQRRDWKIAEVKASVEKATAAPWGKDVCKML